MTEFYDAHATAKEGEPTFTLQGGDPDAPEAILHYAERLRTRARRIDKRKQAVSLLQRASACDEVAWAFNDYRNEKPATPTRSRAPSDSKDLAAGAVNAAAARAALISGVAALRNAVGYAKEVEEALAKLDLHPDQQAVILQGISLLNAAADAIDPRAPGERT